MVQQLNLPLPELTNENFSHGWTRFKLVTKAKEWNEAKQLVILSTLLREKLLDHCVDFDGETKADLK